MSSSTSPAPPADRCPRCSAHVRAGSGWCTLCYTDLRPAPPEPATVAAAVSPLPATPDPVVAAPPAAPSSGGRGTHARRAPDAHVDVIADQMLAQLAVAERRNPLGPVSGVVDTTGKKVLLMVGGTLVAILLLLALMAGIGALL